jgi:aryl-alcohol dehydrogenase-like predicted oxidoreductase
MIPWSPLEGGLLAGVLAKQADISRRVNDWALKEVGKLRPRLTQWEDFCRELGSAPADVGLAWVLSNPLVTAPIIGPRTMEQLTGCLRALDLRLDESARKRIDEIWPGPGGEAPEAYAW